MDINDPDNHNGVITHLGQEILKCKAKGAFRSITRSKASGGDRIAVALFEILKNKQTKKMQLKCCTQYVSKF